MADVKWSQFPSVTPSNSDEVVGLHAGDNARFSIANIVAAVRQGLSSIFVPLTRTINGKGLSSDISLDSSDIDYDNTGSGLTATDVQEAIDELAQGGGGGSATDIAYDPTTSGASATNVQDALDEAFGDLDDKQDNITANGILKGDGAGGVTAATAGTDYQAPLTAGTDYATPAQLADKSNQSQLAYVETGTTATKTGGYTAGEYICWQGTLYTANTNIAYGTTLSAGTGGNLTECLGGGFNDLIRSETIPLSIADTAHISNISNCQCVRIGRVCILRFACQISTTGTGWGYLINVGITPKMDVTFSAFTSEGYRFSFAISDAGGNGVIAKAENKSIQGGYYVGSVVFPV